MSAIARSLIGSRERAAPGNVIGAGGEGLWRRHRQAIEAAGVGCALSASIVCSPVLLTVTEPAFRAAPQTQHPEVRRAVAIVAGPHTENSVWVTLKAGTLPPRILRRIRVG